MNTLSMEKKVAVITALCEGASVRSASRMTGVGKNTVLRLLASVGTACAKYQDRVIRNVASKRVQVDEIWSFVGCKQKNVTAEKMEQGVCGDVWTFVAIDADTKLVISWMMGQRDAGFATEFLRDVEKRLSRKIQLTTDGHKMYLNAVVDAFAPAGAIDYAQLIKVFGNDHAVALFYMHYNFVRIHQTLRVTPAMAAGVTSRLWSIPDILAMTEHVNRAVREVA